MTLTLTERQISALFGTVRSMNLTGSRIPVTHGPEAEWRIDDFPTVTDEEFLTREEMHDLALRLRMFLYPVVLNDAEVPVEVEVEA